MDELERTLILEERVVQEPRSLDDILRDICQATTEKQIQRFKHELWRRMKGEPFWLDDTGASIFVDAVEKLARRR